MNVHGVLSKRDHYSTINNHQRSSEVPMVNHSLNRQEVVSQNNTASPITNNGRLEFPMSDLKYMEFNSFLIFPTFKVETWTTNQRAAPYYLVWQNPSTGRIKKANIKDGSIVNISCGLMPQPQVAEGNIIVKNNTIILSIRNSYGVTMTLYPDMAVPGVRLTYFLTLGRRSQK